MKAFRANQLKYLDEKYWSSISALHWVACFLDLSFKHFEFVPSDVAFKSNLKKDIDKWTLTEMKVAAPSVTRKVDFQQQQQQSSVDAGVTLVAAW